jgi:hypothetical protein
MTDRMQRVPLRDLSHLHLSIPDDDSWIEQLNWIPVGASEYHLACRHFPLALRIVDQRPELGLLVHSRYLVRPSLDESRKWCGIYRPIALRCFPFEADGLHNDPLSDITVPAGSNQLSPSHGIPLVDQDGQPSKAIAEIHRLLMLLNRSREIFADALDQYLIAELLAPLRGPADGEQPLYVIDRNRLNRTGHAALGAMARHRMLSVDLAIAWTFSLQNLQVGCLPEDTGRARHPASSQVAPISHPVSILMDELALVLDDGELVSLGCMDGKTAPGGRQSPEPVAAD